MSLDFQEPIDQDYELGDRYALREGRVFLTGTQALLRVVLDQARRDLDAGLDTAGFVSGYRGSPLGAVDQEFQRNAQIVSDHKVTFLPAINEDLAATAVLGSQQVETDKDRSVTGVFGMWYGKGPGVDRAADALKHGNAYGASEHGGVLVVAGDDHGCVSSSMPHQSDVAFMSFFMPILNPANVAEILSFGEYGYALSRFSGMWVGFKAISETIESGMSVALQPSRVFAKPDYEAPAGGLHYRWPDLPGPQIEERMEAKKNAALAFARANPIDHAVFDNPHAKFGIVTTGKGHLDLMEALRLLGIDAQRAKEISLDVYKVGMVWPLEHHGALAFAQGKDELLVVEEKRGIIESQLKEYFYDNPGQKPARMIGKRDENGARLLPWIGELTATRVAQVLRTRLLALFPELDLPDPTPELAPPVITTAGSARTPYFCSGCPHSTSTKVPDGSEALAGIGCHFMASWMERNTTSLIQMGGEGVNWVSRSLYNGNKHIFQNLGDGTYYHSGFMAIRQAIAAKTNITYKILFNDAVAMTGGQNVDGPISVESIAKELRAEGVDRIAVVSDHPQAFRRADFPQGVTIDDRRQLDRVQRDLREVPGVSILIYQQTCATEKRRLRKRGKLDDPKKFAVINDLVCEGCGDCSVESNCLSVEPKETPFGRKRQINLNSCNKDFTCVNGFCPSFVTVEGGTRKKRTPADVSAKLDALQAQLSPPQMPDLEVPFDILVTGVGGTGVVTVGQLIAMAAHLENKGVSVLDFMGFAQKFGPVISYLRIGARPELVKQVRIEECAADALIGCDLVVSTMPKASKTIQTGVTKSVLNSAEMPTGEFTRNRDADLNAAKRLDAIQDIVGAANMRAIDSNHASNALLGDGVYSNILLLGVAWQSGLVPLSLEALMRAIELNGVAIDNNKAAFTWGRIAAALPDAFAELAQGELQAPETLDQLIARRVAFLADYQNAAWADTYRSVIDKAREAEARLDAHSGAFTAAAARALFKVMSYKDEYEVARLHVHSGFVEGLSDRFEGDFKVKYHLAPPLWPSKRDARGRPMKMEFGSWIRLPMTALAKMKALRGTAFDPFGYTKERRMERAMIAKCETTIERLTAQLSQDTIARSADILEGFMEIKGFGPVKEAAAKLRLAEIDEKLADLDA
jgi:indolepyruvate ferredoxin oxidoreductase